MIVTRRFFPANWVAACALAQAGKAIAEHPIEGVLQMRIYLTFRNRSHILYTVY